MEDLALSAEWDGPYDSSADEFYEQIEAPKFVDLTEKDPVRVNDRYWFCSRVGCDQKHEEELDSEEVYKNFLLRVMAARSPNVRLQRILNRQRAPLANSKCPNSAPPKSTRPQMSRLALLPSSKTIRQLKGSVQGAEEASLTPNRKVKVVASKYMTTPGNRNNVKKQDHFRSAQNPKAGGCVGEGESRVAKALVFQSPKKSVKLKASLELKTPVRRACEKLKKIELDEGSRKKRVLGCSPKSSSKSSTAMKVKPKVTRPWRAEGSAKKQKSQDMSQKCDNLERAMSVECSNENQVCENLVKVENQEMTQQPSGSDKNPVSGSSGEVSEDAMAATQQPSPVIHGSLVTQDDDDKENESTLDPNRSVSAPKTEDLHNSGKKIPGSEKLSKKILKVTRSTTTPKDTTAADMLVQKFNKPKPTNPKPFRLRTDERSILKEAHREKMVRSVTPMHRNETAPKIGKCHGEIIAINKGSEAKTSIKKIITEEVPEKPSVPNMLKPKSIAAKTPEKPKSILSSGKRKNGTPNRDKITRKPTVSFLIPGETIAKVSSVNKSEKPTKDSSLKSPNGNASETPTLKAASGRVKKLKNSAWRLH